ncbi:MAG: TatD family hydrolase [Clostridia bacterium]|nr:TatD family hydrolase [Clostridia bacterium]
MFDTHIHLTEIEHAELLKLLERPDFRYVSCGTDKKSIMAISELTARFEHVYGALGIHPSFADDAEALDSIKELIRNNSKLIAIGEAGLDARYADMDRQIHIFEQQIILAEETGLPIIVHNVRATDRIISLMERHPLQRYMIHGFSGSVETAKRLLLFDTYFGIGRTVTYGDARRLRSALSVIPRNRLLIETDDPYMDREDMENDLYKVLKGLADILGMDQEEVEYITDRNAEEAFSL